MTRRTHLTFLRCALVVGAMLGGGVAAAVPAQAQGPDDFLNDVNNIGLGNRTDSHNFDLVGLGHAICWRLYEGEAPGQIADMVFSSSRSEGPAALGRDQATAVVGYALSDLCPDAALK
jgi:Protein of unknown function (DUF732)